MEQLFNEGIDYEVINNEMWNTYISVDESTAKKVEELFLHLNYPMFLELVKELNTRKHRIDATAEDALQMIYYNYLLNLRFYRDDRGETEYPKGIYIKTLNDCKTSINSGYTDGGMKIPYATKKRWIKEGKYQTKRNDPTVYAQIVSGVDEYEILENDWFDKLQAYTISTEDFVTSMNAPEIKSYIKNALNKALNMIPEMERDIVLMRFAHAKKSDCMSWQEIGDKYGMTEGGVRYKCAEALKKLRKICIKEFQLDACLA